MQTILKTRVRDTTRDSCYTTGDIVTDGRMGVGEGVGRSKIIGEPRRCRAILILLVYRLELYPSLVEETTLESQDHTVSCLSSIAIVESLRRSFGRFELLLVTVYLYYEKAHHALTG
jgi:hypothetical protein